METITGLVGRDREVDELLKALRSGRNVLIVGAAGAGKSALLNEVRRQVATDTRYPPTVSVAGGSAASSLIEIGRQLHQIVGLSMPRDALGPRQLNRHARQGFLFWEDIARPFARLTAAKKAEAITAAASKTKVLLLFDTLEVPPVQAAIYKDLLDTSALAIACMDSANRRERIKRLLWQFPLTVELQRLPLLECERIIHLWLEQEPIAFSSERVRKTFIRHAARESGGNPSALRAMLEDAALHVEITPAIARTATHEAGVRYLDMTPALILAIVGFMALRYIGRGLGEMELLILSGVASALLMGIRFFMWQIRK